jgi:hypothetical protein
LGEEGAGLGTESEVGEEDGAATGKEERGEGEVYTFAI